MFKYHTFISENYPEQSIVVGERDDGTYFIPAALDQIKPEDNVFDSIEQIELTLGDKLTLIIPKSQVN